MTNQRKADAKIDSQFIERWSPRGFKPAKVPRNDLESIIEAARWAPSCYGDQPWMLFIAEDEQDRQAYLNCLAQQNQTWAKNAPVLMFLAGKKTFSANDKINNWQKFDCGSFWMSLSLQANKLGLFTHAMAGFSSEKASKVLKISEDEYEIIVAIALGYYDPDVELPEDLKKAEKPNQRKHFSSFTYFGDINNNRH